MADSVELSATQSINNQTNSSEHSSLKSKLSSRSENGLCKAAIPACGTLLGPGQVTNQHTLDHQSSTSVDLSPSATFHENSDTEDAPSLPMYGPANASTASTLEVSMSSCCENLGADGEYSRTTKLPRLFRISQHGKLPSTSRNYQSLRSETIIEPPASVYMIKLWKWEVLSCVLAISMFGLICGTLQHYDGQRTPDWGTAINLSTLAALMATLLRAMLGFVLAEIIGQSKWKYFAGDGRLAKDSPMRRLIETSRFSDASQGSISAVRLLPTIIRDPATSLAIMVMTVSFGTGSFVQQAIQTQSCQFTAESVNASLPVSRNITGWNYAESGLFDPYDNPETLAALISAFAPDNEEIGSPISAGCPTGNCTFQNSIEGVYGTLGVCSSCVDTSSLILLTERTAWWAMQNATSENVESIPHMVAHYTKHSLPNGMSAKSSFRSDPSPQALGMQLSVSTSQGLGLDWAGDLVSLDMKALSGWAFANVTILSPTWLTTSTGNPDYVAATCTLYPCLRSYSASVASGKLDEVLVNTVPALPDVTAMLSNYSMDSILHVNSNIRFISEYDTDVDAIWSPCPVNDTVWTKENQSSTLDVRPLSFLNASISPQGVRDVQIKNLTAPAECIYRIDQKAASYFSKGLTQKVLNGSCYTAPNFDSTGDNWHLQCGETYWLSRLYDDSGTTATGIIKQIEEFTDRLSNKMRMGLMNNPEKVYGQVQQAAVCSRIDYRWLAFPAVLVAVTSGLLAWTIFRSSRRPGREMVWKTSILPFLFYGDRFVVQNGEDMSAESAGSPRSDGPKEPLLDLDQMEAEAKQRVVRFNAFE